MMKKTNMNENQDKINKIVELIKKSPLDETIQKILVRDLEAEGLTDFLKEQIKVYCLEGLQQLDDIKKEAKKILEEKSQTPAQ
jgi:hypothetical protein